MSTSITYRGDDPAIEVKDHTLYARDPKFRELSEKLGETRVNHIYEEIQEAFWQCYAPEIAKQYGYGEISADGRSSGWMLVAGADLEPEERCEHCQHLVMEIVNDETRVRCENCEHWQDDAGYLARGKWAKFEKAIDALIAGCREQFYQSLRDAIEADDNEVAEAHEMACRDIATVPA